MTVRIALSQWLSFLILRERRKQDAYTNEKNGDTNDFVKKKKAAQLEYIETAISVALFLVQALIVSTTKVTAQQIAVDNFTVVIDDVDDITFLQENPENIDELQRMIESVTQLEFTPSVKNDSSIHTNNGVQQQQQQQQSDNDVLLKAVGSVLHQLFCRGVKPTIPSSTSMPSSDEGHSDKDNEEEYKQPGTENGSTTHSVRVAQKMLRRASISNLDEHLVSNGVPKNLCRMVIDLLRVGSEETKFHSREEVAEELIQVISKPDLFLYDSGSDSGTGSRGHLNFGSTMYGRRNEAASLLRAATLVSLDRMEAHSKQLVLVEGLPGAGKTHFVESIISLSDGWIYIHAKFDPNSQPLSVVTSAFNRFFTNILANRSEQYVSMVISFLQRNLSSSAIVSLCDLIPSLRILFPSVLRRVVSDDDLVERSGRIDDDEFASGLHMSPIRLHFLFRKLISAVCSAERPLTLFFDDLQWADDRCLELISALLERYHLQELEDEGGTHCLFIGSVRSNEISSNLLSHFHNFEQSTSVDVTKIQLGGLTGSDSNNMISEVLRLPARLTRPLNDVVQRKTTGNPFHIITFMHSLVNDSILNYSLSEDRWIWDIEAVKATSIDKTVLELLSRKLSQLPESIVNALKVISCLGSKVDDVVMKYLYPCPQHRAEFIACLDSAVSENILEINGDSAYNFVHDILKQSAYELMTEEEKGQKHFWIGMHLISHTSEDTDKSNTITFSIVDQINAANTYGVTEEDLHIKFAELNLKAGNISIDLSDFQSALSYMTKGVSFLQGWQGGQCYDLSHQLYESAARMSYINTDIGLMQKYLAILFENATCFEDKLHGYLIVIQSMISNGEQSKAMSKLLFILEELGESISIDVDPKDVYAEVASTRSLLDGFSIDDVIDGKRMTDKRLRWSLKFLSVLFLALYKYCANSQAALVVACRILRLSVEHGFCSDSAYGLQGFGWSSMNFQHDAEESIKWFRAGKRLAESFGAKQLIPTVACALNILLYWTEPLQAKIETLKDHHRELLMVGDMDTLSLNAVHFGRRSLLCGRNLLTAEKECAALIHEMYQLRQIYTSLPMIGNHLSILKLIGSNHGSEQQLSEPLFHLLNNSQIHNQDGLLQHALSNGLVGIAQQSYFDRLVDAFWSRNYSEAAQYAEKYSECHQMSHFPDQFQTFYQGITAFRLARLGDDTAREWEGIGNSALAKYQKWVLYSDWNWENKMLLLEAESYACKGQLDIAKSKFQASIDSARKHRFIHEEGLAKELLGKFCEENGNKEEAMQQYSDARSCYQKWGAFALADQLFQSTEANNQM